ncbi:tape measure protein [Acidipropionibacterium timonense]|uniref:tape measure protein n=1 Tax=Acidipropionibacterium timonense TaxID=2161818 RepID=UPI00103099A5|nr:tape measure protein [Acidipropionibacterium timonense]
MATELAQGYLSLSVGFDGSPTKQLNDFLAGAQRSADRAGKAMGRSLSAGVRDGVEQARADTESARKTFESAEQSAKRAYSARENAAKAVEIAQAKLNETQAKYADALAKGAEKSSALLAAEDRAARAKQRLARAELDVAAADQKRSEAGGKVTEAIGKQEAAEKRAADSHRGVLASMRDGLAALQAKMPNPYASMPAQGSKSAQETSDRFAKTLQRASSKMGTTLKSGLSASFKVAVGSAAAAAATGVGALTATAGVALTKGFSRLSSIDQATQKLRGLGSSAKDVSQIMQDSLSSVKGTAFGLDEAATTSAMMVATGIKPGRQLASVLRTVADTATIAGMSMSDAGRIFSSVAARGKLQGDDMMQLTSQGVPVLQLLSKQLHKSTADVSTMVSKGKIDFATFSAAMQQGLGGSAKQSGQTFTGAMKNIGASLGRVGANFMGGVFPKMAPLFNGVTTSLGPLEDGAKKVGSAIGSVLGPAIDKLTRTLSSGGATTALKGLRDGLGGLYDVLVKGDFTQRFADAFHMQEDSAFTGWLLDVHDSIAHLGDGAAGARKKISDALGSLKPVVSGVWSGLSGDDAFKGADLDGKLSRWQRLGEKIRGALSEGKRLLTDFFSSVTTFVKGAGAALGPFLGDLVKLAGATALGAVVGALKILTPMLRDVGRFMAQHKKLVGSIAAGLVTFAAGYKAVTVAMDLWAARTKIVAAAQAALNVVMNLNPIGIVVAGIATLAAGLIYAYRHSETFRKGVNAAFSGVKKAAVAIGQWFSGPFVGFFKSAFGWVAKVAVGFWHGIVATFTAIHNGVLRIVEVMWARIKFAFTLGKGIILYVADSIKSGVITIFTGIKDGAIRAFTGMKDGIKKVWDAVKSIVSKPIRWVIDTPINKGLIAAVASVQRFFGVKNPMKPLSIAGFRGGGVIPGSFDPAHRDNVLGLSIGGVPTARVEPGEFVVNRRQTARNLPLLHAINSGLHGYAGGGLVGGSGRWSQEFERRLMAVAASLNATLQIAQRGFRPATPWSGTSHRGDAVDVVGGADLWKIRDALRSQGIAAWVRGPAQKFSWHVHGIPLPGAGIALGSAVYQQQAYRAGGDGLHGLTGKDPYDRGGSRPGWLGRAVSAVMSWADQLAAKAKAAFGGLADPMAFVRSKLSGLSSQISGHLGSSGWATALAGLPGKLAGDAVAWARGLWDKLKRSGADGGQAGTAGNQESWRPMVARALAATGIGGGRSDEDKWLRQIMTESSGNPKLIQSSAVYDVNIAHGDPARGLVQVPKVTWDDFGKDMGSFLPNVYNPLKNLIVGMRAANAQHRNWRAVIGYGHGYVGGGTVPFSQIAALSEDGRPEIVVGAQMRKLNAGSTVFNARQTAQMLGRQSSPSVLVVRDVDDQLVGRMYVEGANAFDDRWADLARTGAAA